MSIYVLVHGAWHGGWCWDKIVPLLEKEGHTALAPDLPGHGQDRTPIRQLTLQSYVDRVLAVLDAQLEPVVLVAHSLGGITVSEAAEQRPEKVKKLVYLCAFLLRNGESVPEVTARGEPSLLRPNVVLSEDESYVMVKEEALKEVFYADCLDKDVEWAKSLLFPREPTSPRATPITISENNFGQIPRVYIECLGDKAINPSVQKAMHMALPCEKVITMNTSHSPFLSAPEELSRHLLEM